MKTPDDYGATGTGDEAPAVQAWASDNVGKSARLPRKYRIASRVVIPDGFEADGDDGSGFVVDAAAPAASLFIIGADCRLAGMSIDAAALPPRSSGELVTLYGARPSRLERVAFVGDPYMCLAVTGAAHELVDVSFDRVTMSVWDAAAGAVYTRPRFTDTRASPYTLTGTGTRIHDAVATRIGENVLMSTDVCDDIRIDGFAVADVRRSPAGDNGVAFEINGRNWLLSDIDIRRTSWSGFVFFEPQDVELRRVFIRNPGHRFDPDPFVPEAGPDTSACIKIYNRARSFGRPPARDFVLSDFVLHDDTGRNHAVTIMGAPDSDQITDLYIGAGSMPGAWKNGQAIDARMATTDGVTRPVCGPRCYNGNAILKGA